MIEVATTCIGEFTVPGRVEGSVKPYAEPVASQITVFLNLLQASVVRLRGDLRWYLPRLLSDLLGRWSLLRWGWRSLRVGLGRLNERDWFWRIEVGIRKRNWIGCWTEVLVAGYVLEFNPPHFELSVH